MCFETWILNNTEFKNKLFAVDTEYDPNSKSQVQNICRQNLFDYNIINFFKLLKFFVRDAQNLSDLNLLVRNSHDVFKSKFVSEVVKSKFENIIVLASESWVMPLWIHEVGKINRRVIFVNLSTSRFPIICGENLEIGWEALCLWNEVWVLDQTQANKFIQSNKSKFPSESESSF
jgi:hypothetical protein